MNKKVFSLLPCSTYVHGGYGQSTANDPVIMTIDGDPIYKSEFEYVYNKTMRIMPLIRRVWQNMQICLLIIN